MRFRTIGRRLRRPPRPALRIRIGRWLMLLFGACVDMWQCRHAALKRRYAQTTRPATSLLDEPWLGDLLQNMGARRFEMLMQLLFERRGTQNGTQAGTQTGNPSATQDGASTGSFTSARTRDSECGLDIWFYRPGGRGAPTDLVQCRHWPGKRIGVDKLLPLWALMRRHELQRGRIATCASFTEEAVAFALDHGIELLDAEVLAEMILNNPAARLLIEPALRPPRQMAGQMVDILTDSGASQLNEVQQAVA